MARRNSLRSIRLSYFVRSFVASSASSFHFEDITGICVSQNNVFHFVIRSDNIFMITQWQRHGELHGGKFFFLYIESVYKTLIDSLVGNLLSCACPWQKKILAFAQCKEEKWVCDRFAFILFSRCVRFVHFVLVVWLRDARVIITH